MLSPDERGREENNNKKKKKKKQKKKEEKKKVKRSFDDEPGRGRGERPTERGA